MVTFAICLTLLVVAYFTYGRYLEKVCRIDPSAKVPSETHYDGVDYLPLPRWRVFLIQLLNIAGVGPIFGAILGACFGPVAFVWITLGGIFLGAMHDFISGVIFVRHDGHSLPEVIGNYLGKGVQQFIRIFSIVLLILVGVVFMRSPAGILNEMIPEIDYSWWLAIIVVYYFIATILPIDKLIGKVYPFFGAALLFMALGLFGVLIFGDLTVPDLTPDNWRNFQHDAESLPIMPTLFISIACGAISGFHITQSPMMARCLNNEKECRMIFYGAMISESIIALIWAGAAMAFFHGTDGLIVALAEHGNDAAWAVNTISTTTLGLFGGFLAMLGVVAAPITSGDTAFRSARLIIADIFKIEQRSIPRRLMISLPIFIIGMVMAFVDFDIIWRYFAWSNQTLSIFALWMIVIYLKKRKSNFWIALFPAIFMTYVCTSFMFISDQFFGMENRTLAYIFGGVATIIVSGLILISERNGKKNLS